MAIAATKKKVPFKDDIVAGPASAIDSLAIGKAAWKKKKQKEKRDVVGEFNNYFGNETRLDNWARFCRDLGLEGDFTSINKCRVALAPVWINIYNFLDEMNGGKKARRFETEQALAIYTRRTGKYYPREGAKNQGPVRALLAHILHPGKK